jgi:hypothetical protein
VWHLVARVHIVLDALQGIVINLLIYDFALVNILFGANTGKGVEMDARGGSQEGSDWGHSGECKGGCR